MQPSLTISRSLCSNDETGTDPNPDVTLNECGGDEADVGRGARISGGDVHERGLYERAALAVEAAVPWMDRGKEVSRGPRARRLVLILVGTHPSANSWRSHQ